MFDRTGQGLSKGVQLNKIQLKLTELFNINGGRVRENGNKMRMKMAAETESDETGSK